MNEIIIKYDKWENKATVNDKDFSGGLKVALFQELEWEGKIYIITEVEDAIWEHKAIGIEKEEYWKSCIIPNTHEK